MGFILIGLSIWRGESVLEAPRAVDESALMLKRWLTVLVRVEASQSVASAYFMIR